MKRTGTFLGAPYSRRRPTWAGMKKETWNRSSRRLFVPRQSGWGWSINFARLFRRR